jgi:hypothetical protein
MVSNLSYSSQISFFFFNSIFKFYQKMSSLTEAEINALVESYTIRMSSNTLDDCAIELGVYFFFLALWLFFLLD